MKIALVTGSTSGIGLATARRLYDDGLTVIFNSPSDNDNNVLDQFEDKSRVSFFAADISRPQAVSDLKEYIKQEFDRLDYLVANAGVLPLPAGVDTITEENINKTIDVNLKGTFNTLKLLGKFIQETSKDGSIVALTSVDGIIGEPYGVIYSATKAGVISWTHEGVDIHVTHKEATKEHAVGELLNILGLDKSEVVGVGDADNDVHLFEAVGRKVAVGNATDKLKSLADEVIESVDNDGLAKFIKGQLENEV